MILNFECGMVVAAKAVGVVRFSNTTISCVYRWWSKKIKKIEVSCSFLCKKYPTDAESQVKMARLVPDERRATVIQIIT